MASLTDTAQLARTFFKFLVLFIIVCVVGFYAVRYIMRTFFAPKPVVIMPTVRLGDTLPPPVFPKSAYQTPQLSIDTLTGDLPQFDRIATVHALQKQKLTFRGKEQATRKAQSLGFTAPPKQLSTDVLEFTDEQLPLRTFTIDLAQNHFTLKYNYTQDNSVFNSSLKNFEDDQVTQEAINTLANITDLPKELGSGTTSIEYLEYQQNQLVPVQRVKQADAARVNFFRASLDNLPVIFALPSESSTYVLIGQTQDQRKRVLEANYQFRAVSDPPPRPDDKRDPNPTYYIKSTRDAYAQLQAGKGYIAQSNGESTAVITDVSLAYYENKDSPYLYPIFVFSGDNFTAYVSALLDDYTTTKASPAEAVQGVSTRNSLVPIDASELPRQSDRRSPKPPRKFSDLLQEQTAQ